MRGLYFYGCVGAFAVGTASALLEKIDLGEGALVLIIAVAGSSLCFLSGKRGIGCALCIVLAGFGVGALRASFDLYQQREALDMPVGEHVALQGVVAEDPVITARHQKLIIRGDMGKVIMFAPVYPAFAYGDTVTARGVLKRPESFVIEESGRIFNYPAYLAKDDIRYILDKPKLEKAGKGKSGTIKRGFITVRKNFVATIERVVLEPYAGLAAGVVLGVDGALSKEDEGLFRTAGLVHVVVVSGYNITLVGDMMARLLSRLPLFLSSIGSLIGIVAFIMLTGASATAIRAGIMASLVLLARVTRRHYDMQRALFAAGFLMILHTPDILLYDPSFQLSFLATWGLGSLTPYAERFFAWMPLYVRTIAATTLATQTAVTPLLLYMSGNLSVLSLPANILALPVIPLIMAGTMVIGILGFLPDMVLLPISSVVYGAGAYVFSIVELIDRIPWSSARVPALSLGVLGVLYAALVVSTEAGKRKAAPPFRDGGAAIIPV